MVVAIGLVVLTIMLALHPIILAIMLALELIVNPPILATAHAVIMGLIVLALKLTVITVMLAFDPVVLIIVPVAPSIIVRQRRSRKAHQRCGTQKHVSKLSHCVSPLSPE